MYIKTFVHWHSGTFYDALRYQLWRCWRCRWCNPPLSKLLTLSWLFYFFCSLIWWDIIKTLSEAAPHNSQVKRVQSSCLGTSSGIYQLIAEGQRNVLREFDRQERRKKKKTLFEKRETEGLKDRARMTVPCVIRAQRVVRGWRQMR